MAQSAPYFLFYPADYLADTAHLTRGQHASYLLLLMNYWQTGKPLNNASERLAIVAKASSEEWATDKEVLAEFFDIEGDTWTHGRMEHDLLQVRAKSIQNSYAGRKGGLAGKKKPPKQAEEESETEANAKQTLSESEAMNEGMNEGMNEKDILKISYQKFLEIYPRVVDPNGKTKKAFEKATKKTDPEIILKGALNYRNDPNRDPAFTCISMTWLNQERWLVTALPATNKPKGQTFLETFRQSEPERLALN